MTLLSVQALHAYRGPAYILRGVSLTVAPGEVVCLVGRNGAGKTTTLECIMGLLPVRGGTVRFDERDITRMEAHERAWLGIGYAPEDAGVFPDLTVQENLLVGIWMGTRSKRVRAYGRPGESGGKEPARRVDPGRLQLDPLLALFPELERLLPKRALYLSGGEKKMLAIARAISTNPTMLLLDEPLEGLAPVVVSRFRQALSQIKSMGLGLLVAESNVVNAMALADRVYVIERGEILFSGTPAALEQASEVLALIRG